MNNQNRQISLKPVDIVVALSLTCTERTSVKSISLLTGVSTGETHNSLKRLALSGLVSAPRRIVAVDRLLAFLEHGVSVTFPAVWLPASSGVPTALVGVPAGETLGADVSVVWPSAGVQSRGRGLAPLYPNAVTLPARNPLLYELLMLVDTLRTGAVRERRRALEELRSRLRGAVEGAPPLDHVAISEGGQKIEGASAVVAQVAMALRPILNRVVFAGRAAAELLADQPGFRARMPEDASVTLLTSVALDRLAADLRALGLERTARGDAADAWRLPSGIRVDVIHVDTGEDGASPWREYALLLTRDAEIEPSLLVRLSGGPATAALLFERHDAAGVAPSDSLAAEDLLVLVAGRAQLIDEVKAAPAELRVFIATHAETLLRSGSLPMLAARANADAAVVPEIVAAIERRMQALASLR